MLQLMALKASVSSLCEPCTDKQRKTTFRRKKRRREKREDGKESKKRMKTK